MAFPACTTPFRKSLLLAIACGLAVFLAACSPQSKDGQASEEQNSDVTAVEFAWSVDSDCGICHENAVLSFGDSSCTASLHADMEDQCLACHDDVSSLEEAHVKVTFDSEKKQTKLKKTEVSEEICLGCHDKAEIVAATAESVVLTDENGTVVNPHGIPDNEDHANASIDCSSCHKLHASEGSAEVAPGVCANCHHHGVYECGTCHT